MTLYEHWPFSAAGVLLDARRRLTALTRERSMCMLVFATTRSAVFFRLTHVASELEGLAERVLILDDIAPRALWRTMSLTTANSRRTGDFSSRTHVTMPKHRVIERRIHGRATHVEREFDQHKRVE